MYTEFQLYLKDIKLTSHGEGEEADKSTVYLFYSFSLIHNLSNLYLLDKVEITLCTCLVSQQLYICQVFSVESPSAAEVDPPPFPASGGSIITAVVVPECEWPGRGCRESVSSSLASVPRERSTVCGEGIYDGGRGPWPWHAYQDTAAGGQAASIGQTTRSGEMVWNLLSHGFFFFSLLYRTCTRSSLDRLCIDGKLWSQNGFFVIAQLIVHALSHVRSCRSC